jgi:hypothetical protein
MFAVPTYAFIAAIATLVVAGLVHAAGHGFHPIPVHHLAMVQDVTVLLVLRAFASGATAMTGIEAISNAVPSFKPVEWRNARITLSWMIGLLIAMFGGVLVITRLAGIVPVASLTTLSRYPSRAAREVRSAATVEPAERVAAPGSEATGAEQPGQVNTLTIVIVEVMDRAGIQALAYAAALGQPAFALHISPTAEEADRFLGYWRAWGDHLPLEVIVSPHRAVIAPLANYLWTLHEQRPDLTLTVVIPELVDRHWWHRILYEHVTQRLQPVLQPLPE